MSALGIERGRCLTLCVPGHAPQGDAIGHCPLVPRETVRCLSAACRPSADCGTLAAVQVLCCCAASPPSFLRILEAERYLESWSAKWLLIRSVMPQHEAAVGARRVCAACVRSAGNALFGKAGGMLQWVGPRSETTVGASPLPQRLVREKVHLLQCGWVQGGNGG